MTRTVTEEMDGITVRAVYSSRQKDYLVYTSLTAPNESVAWVSRRPERPRSSEWGVAWRTGPPVTWYPTLSSALYAIGSRVARHIKEA